MKENIKQKPLPVTFTDKGFINSKRLNEYDLDGQLYALDYFLRTQKWKIKDNKIVFPELNDDFIVDKLLKIHTSEYMNTLIKARLEQVTNCSFYGIESCRNTLEKELQHNKKVIDNCKNEIEQSQENHIEDMEMEE